MNLQLILGSSGSGKTFSLQETLCKEALLHPEKTYLYIVPEQFTLETQRELVQRQTGNTIMNIDVLSFLRLAWRIFEELGLQDLPVLDDMGKNMVLRRVLSECGKDLHYFRGDIRKLGFLSELKSLLSEFTQYDIREQDLDRMILEAQKRPMLKGKLEDAKKIQKAFQEFKKDRFITAEEILIRLIDTVKYSELLKNCVICFDGFTGFTPVQMELLQEIFHYVAEARVTITIDPREKISKTWDDFELFSMSKKMLFHLIEIAKETGSSFEICYTSKGQVPYRFVNVKELAHLEQMIFRYPYQKYTKKPERISLYAALNPEEELWLVLKKIKGLIRNGYRYRDIAVITGDMEGYAQTAAYCFRKAGVPFFMDYKKSILSNPYVEFLRSFLAMLEKDFSYEAVFRHLGNGLMPWKKEEKDRIENYILATGIRGRKRWKKEWERAYSEEIKEQLPELNKFRQQFLELVAPSAGRIGYDLFIVNNKIEENKEAKEKTAKRKRKGKIKVLDYVYALYEYSQVMHCEEQLWGYETYFRQKGEHNLEREYAQVYKKVMELLERMAELLGDEIVTLREFMELFDAGIAEVKIGLIPPGLDQVIIGDLERTRLNHLKALFFIGLNDGIVPKVAGHGGILSDLEREYLSSREFELAPTQRELGYRGQFYLYLTLTKPDSFLQLSYCRMDQECNALRPSYLLRKIQTVFPELKEIIVENGFQFTVENKDSLLEKEMDVCSILGADYGSHYFLEGLRFYKDWETMPILWKSLFSYYKEKQPKKWKQLLFCAFGGNGKAQLPKNIARLLYGKDLYGSVTRFEQYAACQYAHFLAYGLRLRERQEFMLRSIDIGNVFHKALCIFGEKASKLEGGWHGFSQQEEEVRIRLTEESLMETLQEEKIPGAKELLNDTARNYHFLERIRKMLQKTTEILVYQVLKGTMEPSGYEINFSKMKLPSTKILLSEQESIHLHGQIDRLDQTKQEPLAIRVVDYKTGKKEFSLLDVYYGLQMQLMIYLRAGMESAMQKEGMEDTEETKENGLGTYTAGAYYYRIDDPFAKEKEPEENAWRDQLKLDGISNKKETMVSIQDQDMVIDGKFRASASSDVIPFAVTSKSEIDSRSSLIADSEELSDLMDYVQDTMVRFGKEILDGKMEKNPYKKSAEDTACQYCNYKEMCNPKDPMQEGTFRILSKQNVPEDISTWGRTKEEKKEDKKEGEE